LILDSTTILLPQDLGVTDNPTFEGLTLTGLTEGGLLFAGVDGLISQDKPNLFWKDDTDQFSLGTDIPPALADLTVYGADQSQIALTDGAVNKLIAGQSGISIDVGAAEMAIGTQTNQAFLWLFSNTGITVGTNNIQRVNIEAGGNILIAASGTANTLLDVRGGIDIGLDDTKLRFGASQVASIEYDNGTDALLFDLTGTVNANFNTTGNTNTLYIDTSGKVGIGTNAPTSALTISRATSVAVQMNDPLNIAYWQFGSSGGIFSIIETDAAGGSAGVGRIFRLNPITAPAIIFNLDKVDADLTWSGDTTASIFKLDAGAEELHWTGGNVGIGTLTPVGKLHVDSTEAEALIITKNADGGDVFIIDTTNNTIEIPNDNYKLQLGATLTDLEIYSDGTDGRIDTNGILKVNSSTEFVSKSKITAIGGFAVKLTNTTGAVTVQGQTVKADPATNDAVILTSANDTECIGVFLDAGIADDAEAWVVVAGIADVAMGDNEAATAGNWVETNSTEAGYADATSASPIAAPQHFNEIGHCIETVAAGGVGTHILARCVLHFN
jgi:hypothetical protein